MKSVTSSICLSVLIQVLSQNMSWSIFRSLAPSKSKGNRKYFVTLPRSVVGNTAPDYAEVESGRVADQEGHTAVHHPKVGNHY